MTVHLIHVLDYTLQACKARKHNALEGVFQSNRVHDAYSVHCDLPVLNMSDSKYIIDFAIKFTS